MEMFSDNPYILFFVAPALFAVSFILFVLLVAGPKFFKSITKGGSVEVIYTPPNTSYIHQHIVPQPSKFNPINLSPNYFIGILKPDPEDEKLFEISVIEEEGKKYIVRQNLKSLRGEYQLIREVADLYAQNYGLSIRRIF